MIDWYVLFALLWCGFLVWFLWVATVQGGKDDKYN